ncbi:MAG: hypothetical protein ACHQRM_15480 [Bacteroidia bacterium]
MKSSFLLFCMLLCSFARGQKDSIFDSRFMLKFAPIALLEPFSGPCFRLGAEWKYKSNISAGIECGAYFPFPYDPIWSYINSGFTTKLEMKYYRNKEQQCGGGYYSLELFYKYQAYPTSDSINLTMTSHPYPRDYWVYKNITCLTFKWGKTMLWGKHLITDVYFGLGVRYHYAVNGLSAEENQHIKSSSDYGPNIMESMAGSIWYPNVDMGVKIGYRIK